MVRTPVTPQATSIQPGLPISLDISAETMKMPEPIMAPITTMVASNRFRPRTKPCSRVVVVGVGWLMVVCEPIVSEAGCERDYNREP